MTFLGTHDFPVDLVLRVLGAPASTYYDWRAAKPHPVAGHKCRTLNIKR